MSATTGRAKSTEYDKQAPYLLVDKAHTQERNIQGQPRTCHALQRAEVLRPTCADRTPSACLCHRSAYLLDPHAHFCFPHSCQTAHAPPLRHSGGHESVRDRVWPHCRCWQLECRVCCPCAVLWPCGCPAHGCHVDCTSDWIVAHLLLYAGSDSAQAQSGMSATPDCSESSRSSSCRLNLSWKYAEFMKVMPVMHYCSIP